MPEYKRLEDAVEDYVRHRRVRGKAVTTVTNETYVLRRFAAWYGDVQMRHMTPVRVADWLYGPHGLRSEHRTRDGRHRGPIAASTHNHYRTRLHSFFRFATHRGWIKVDLLEDVDPLRLPTVLRQRPEMAVIAEMVDTAGSDRDRALLLTLAHTALRKSEVTAIRVGDVDLANGWLRVLISKSHLKDSLPITADLDAELRRWFQSYAEAIGRPLISADHVFPARRTAGYRWRTEADGTRFRAPDTWRPYKPLTHAERVVQAALVRVGLPTTGEGAHTLRRAAARAFFDALTQDKGYDSALRVLSAWLHHSNSTTTERYLGLSVERQRRDEWLRGKDFLRGAPAEASVIPFPAKHHSG
jgi:integrase